MPRIAAPTVAEHRENQVSALLGAARAILLEEGLDACTFGNVALHAGLARNSTYQYFSSRAELLVAVCESEFPHWIDAIDGSTRRARTPAGKVRAWITCQLELVARGEHRLSVIVAPLAATGELGPDCQARLGAMHLQLAAPLEEALTELGVSNVAQVLPLVRAVVNEATRRIESGEPLGPVTRAAVDLVLRGVADRR